MAGPAFDVVGDQEIAARLTQIPAAVERATARANVAVGTDLLDVARAAGAGGTAQQAAAVAGITSTTTAEAAGLAIGNTGVAFAIGAFMGARRYPQFPAWVGAEWDIEAGVGPYQVAPAVAAALPHIRDTYDTEATRSIEQVGLNVT